MIPALKRLSSLLCALLAALALAPAHAAPEEPVLNLYNWSDYIGDDTIKAFEKETGIKVHYDNFDSNEILNAKLVGGRTGYDVVVPSSNWARLQLQAGLFRKLDKAQIPNLGNASPAVMAQLAKVDPGNQYLVDWLWGYTAIGINVDKVKAALGGLPMPDNAWDLVFQPRYMARLKSCGVSFLDSPDEVVPLALTYLGKPEDTRSAADYAAAGALLKSVRPYVTLFTSSGYINDMADGTVCVALGWSGDINIARRRAIENHTGQKIEVLVPRRDGRVFFDVMAIPVDAPHPLNAQKWINYILRPEVAAGLTNKVYYANASAQASRFVLPDVARNRTIFLSDQELATMNAAAILPDAASRRLQTRTYTSFKAGIN
jgi:putrescine transport system substrate-binding protein